MARKRYVIDLQSLQTESRFRGAGKYSLGLAEAVARNAGDIEVSLLLCGLAPDTVEFVRSRFDGLLPQDQIRVFDVPGPVKEMEPKNVARARTAEILRDQFLATLNADLIHISSLFEGYVENAVTAVKAADTFNPTSVTLYDLTPLLRPEESLDNPLHRSWYLRKLQSLKRADLLLAVSDWSRQMAIDHLDIAEHRVVNISCGIDPAFRPVVLSPEQTAQLMQRLGIRRPFILCSGAGNADGSLHRQIQAFGLLPVTLRERYQFVLVERLDTEVMRALSEQARTAGLLKDVVFAGELSDEDLIALYGLCEMFVMPSLCEGLGFPLLEAMACGAAAIGSNATGIPELVGRADALFDPTSPADVAAKVNEALSNDSFRQQLRDHGIKQAKGFSWQATAGKALSAFSQIDQEKRRTSTVGHQSCERQRPTLAYVSPLRPQNSGIADYSAELLPALARHYDIDVVTDATSTSDRWIQANFPVRDVVYFDINAARYDRVLYHFGNSPAHSQMFRFLKPHPGTVVLHDFYLSDLVNWMQWEGGIPECFARELYNSHGYPALLQEAKLGRPQALVQFPCNRSVLEGAIGVIVHSEYSRTQADVWYGPGASSDWRVVPHARRLRPLNRKEARSELGLTNEDFLLCSFGLLTPSKLNQRVVSAWLQSSLAQDPRCRLVFIGEIDGDEYRSTLLGQISEAGLSERVLVTGFASSAQYGTYLQAADAAVQLRSRSRGETSGAVLDCLGSGVPTVVNAHGPVAELPADVVIKLDDEFEDCQLATAFEQLYQDADFRSQYSQHARAYIRANHDIESVAGQYRQAIEHFYQTHAIAQETNVITRLASTGLLELMAHDDSIAVAKAMAGYRRALGPRRLVLDVSGTARHDPKTGIQRVTRRIVKALIADPPPGVRPEPVHDVDGIYTLARGFTLAMLGRESFLPNDEYYPRPDDIWLGLDICADRVCAHKSFFESLRAHNVAIYWLVHDILPVLRPELFPGNAPSEFRDWIDTICQYAEGLICVTRAVADELLAWLDREPPNRLRPLRIGYSHSGADILEPVAKEAAAEGNSSSAGAATLRAMKARPSLLMVGTLEPRKGHELALNAFEMLWAKGTQVNLVIVGHEGWHVESLVDRLAHHKHNGKYLFWLNSADDQVLAKLYGAASGLLAASEAEGFGLPLIEAARYGVPLLARDIPVFREVAGEHAHFFDGNTAKSLKDAIADWLDLYAQGRVPSSVGLSCLTWEESAKRLMDCVLGGNFYREWCPPDRRR